MSLKGHILDSHGLSSLKLCVAIRWLMSVKKLKVHEFAYCVEGSSKNYVRISYCYVYFEGEGVFHEIVT